MAASLGTTARTGVDMREGVTAISPVGDAVGQLVRIHVRLFVEAGICRVVHGVSEGASGTNVRMVIGEPSLAHPPDPLSVPSVPAKASQTQRR